MADIPWVAIIGAFTLIVTTIAGGFGLLYRALSESQKKRIEDLQEDKDFWKGKAADRIIAKREERRAVETEEFGAPSVAPPPRKRDDSKALIITGAEDDAWDAQRKRSAEWEHLSGQRDRRRAPSPALEAFAPPPRTSPKTRLPPGAGDEDYAEMRLRNARGEIVTPVEFRPRLQTHRDPEPTSPGGWDEDETGGMKAPRNALFPPGGKK